MTRVSVKVDMRRCYDFDLDEYQQKLWDDARKAKGDYRSNLLQSLMEDIGEELDVEWWVEDVK